MRLNHSEVIQINATVIAGLLILTTFNSFTSSIDENIISSYLDRLFNAHIDWDKTYRFHEITCNEFILSEESKDSKLFEKCYEIQSSVIEKASEVEALYEWGFEAGILEESKYTGNPDLDSTIVRKGEGGISLKSNMSELVKTGLYVNLITLGTMIPFLASCIIEASYTFRKKSDNDATKIGVVLMIIGFGFIVVGLVWINYFFMKADLTLIPAREMAI